MQFRKYCKISHKKLQRPTEKGKDGIHVYSQMKCKIMWINLWGKTCRKIVFGHISHYSSNKASGEVGGTAHMQFYL